MDGGRRPGLSPCTSRSWRQTASACSTTTADGPGRATLRLSSSSRRSPAVTSSARWSVDLRDGAVIFAGGRQRRDGSLTTSLPASDAAFELPTAPVVLWCGGMGVMFSAEHLPAHRRFRRWQPSLTTSAIRTSACAEEAPGFTTRYCPRLARHQRRALDRASASRDGATVRDLWMSLSSRRSVWNLRDNTLFYAQAPWAHSRLSHSLVSTESGPRSPGVRLLRGHRARDGITVVVPTFRRPGPLDTMPEGSQGHAARRPIEVLAILRPDDLEGRAVAATWGARIVDVTEPGHLPPLRAALLACTHGRHGGAGRRRRAPSGLAQTASGSTSPRRVPSA